MKLRDIHYISAPILFCAFLCVQCLAYIPPCERIILGIVRPIRASLVETDLARKIFEEEISTLPEVAIGWGMPDHNIFNLAIRAARRLCEARGILVAFQESSDETRRSLVILPVLGISALNDFAYFQDRVFSSRVEYAPMALLRFTAAFNFSNRTIYISHRSIANGRPGPAEYHESDHGRLTHNLARGLLSIYQGSGTDEYLRTSIQEYATYPREINGRILDFQRLTRETSAATTTDIEERARHILEIVQVIGHSINATGAPSAAIRWALKNTPTARDLNIERVRPRGGTHDIVWIELASDDLASAIRIPVLSLDVQERLPNPSALRDLLLSRLQALQSIDQQYRERTRRLLQLILPPGVVLANVLDRDADLQRQHLLAAQTFARGLSAEQVTKMVELTSAWRNEIEVQMSTSFAVR